MKRLITLWVILLTLTFAAFASKDSIADVEENQILENLGKSSERLGLRKIIKEGEISFGTLDILTTISLIANSVKELHGYVAEDSVYEFQDKIEHQIVIRIPAKNYNNVLIEISKNAEEIKSKYTIDLDVTDEFLDIEERIFAKKEVENGYTGLLKQANTIEEILAVEEQKRKIRVEIDSIEVELKHLKHRIDYSMLKIICYQETELAFGFSSKFGEALKSGWKNFLRFFIQMTNIWTFALIAAAVYFAYVWYKKRGDKSEL